MSKRAELKAQRERERRELEQMRDALADCVGLLQLISSRDDLPRGLKETIRGHHRYLGAVALLDSSARANGAGEPA